MHPGDSGDRPTLWVDSDRPPNGCKSCYIQLARLAGLGCMGRCNLPTS